MTIGIASNLTLRRLNFDFKGQVLPDVSDFPLISNIVNCFLDRGHKVVVYCLAFNLEEPVVFKDDRLTICVVPRRPQAGRRLFKYECSELVKMMTKYPADIINAQWAYEYALAAQRTGIPTVVTMRDEPTKILMHERDAFRLARWIINWKVMQKVQHLTANSDYLYSTLPEKHKKKAVVINNFYSNQLLEHIEEDIVKQNYIVTVVNGFTNFKNAHSGLKAFAILRKQFPDLQYYLIGADMGEGGAAQQYAQKNGLTDGVNFMGRIPFQQVVNLVKKAKVMLHPSKEESFGNAVVESMVLGTPVVGGSQKDNMPFLLNQGVTGVMCDVTSPESIAKGVASLLTDEAKAKRITKAAREFALDNFSQEKVIDAYLNCYKKVLGVKQHEKLGV